MAVYIKRKNNIKNISRVSPGQKNVFRYSIQINCVKTSSKFLELKYIVNIFLNNKNSYNYFYFKLIALDLN